MLNETEFLSPHGIRALSRRHMTEPYRFAADGIEYSVEYEPAESRTGLFGGNSNWRGPVWFPVNYLLIEALQKFHHYYGPRLHGGVPDGFGHAPDTVGGGGRALAAGVASFVKDAEGQRPSNGADARFRTIRSGATWCCSTVLRRRHGRRAGGEPPDGMDGAGGQAAAAER